MLTLDLVAYASSIVEKYLRYFAVVYCLMVRRPTEGELDNDEPCAKNPREKVAHGLEKKTYFYKP